MTAIIIIIGLIIGINCIPFLTKISFPKTEMVLVRFLIVMTILFLIFTILEFMGYRLKGIYTFPTIAWAFIISTVLYFALFKNTKKKILTVVLITPLITLSILTLLIGRVVYENKIDDNNKISVTTGGFLACGENIKITESRFGLFDKELFQVNNLCLAGINKIETIKIDERHTELLIYHNGKYDSENPYRYNLETKNVW